LEIKKLKEDKVAAPCPSRFLDHNLNTRKTRYGDLKKEKLKKFLKNEKLFGSIERKRPRK
jgi:hypothetical protein